MDASDFPVLDNGIFANHAALSPWPKVTADAVTEFAKENAHTGSLHFRAWMARESALREQLASLIGASASKDIALLKSTTECICAVAYGLTWHKGDNIVLPVKEFPSNRLPWKAQEDHGVEIREVDIRSTDDPEAALLNAMDKNTRILSVSSVQYDDGLRLDLEKLGKACAPTGSLFFIDAIQQLGAIPVDVEACQADFLAADGHKWMLAPESIAVFYSRPSARSQLTLKQQGWHMYEFPWNFSRADWSPTETARMFEAGSPNSVGQVGLHASLGLLLDTGMDHISSRILANTQSLVAGLQSLPDVTVRSDTRSGRQSGIVSFAISDDVRALYKRISDSGVTCALRNGCIRLSPHFYQDERVMNRLLEKVEAAL